MVKKQRNLYDKISLSTKAIFQTALLTEKTELSTYVYSRRLNHTSVKNSNEKLNLLKSYLYDVTCVPVMEVKTRT